MTFFLKVFQVFSIQVKEIKINYNLNTKVIKGSLARLQSNQKNKTKDGGQSQKEIWKKSWKEIIKN